MKKLLRSLLAVGILASVCSTVRADSSTPREGLVKPDIGSTGWGTKLNANFDAIDSSASWQNTVNNFTSSNTFSSTITVNGQLIWQDGYAQKFSGAALNVKDYGCKGDGLTDDATSFQMVLNLSTTTGHRVKVPNGTYLIGSRLIGLSSTTIEGESVGGTIIKAKSSMNDRLFVNSGYALTQTWTYNLTFKNITFDMNGANNTASTAMSFQRNTYLTFEDCRFINPYDSLMLITGTADKKWNHHININRCVFDGTNQQQTTDVFDIGGGSDTVITNSYFYNAKNATGNGMVEVTSINHFIVRDCFFDGNGNGTPIEIKGVDGGAFVGNEVKGSVFEGVGFFAWHEATPYFIGDDFMFSNNNIHDNTNSGILITAPGSSTDTVKNVIFTGNTIHDNGNEAVKVQVGLRLTFANNIFFNNSKNIAGSWAVLNFNGPFAVGDITDVRVMGNTFFDDQVSPTQTFGYNVNHVSTATFHNNFYQNITTKLTNTSSINIQFLDQYNEGVTSFVGTFTRDVSLASGSVSYTGVGFQPSGGTFFATVASTTTYSWGMDDSTHHSCIAHINNDTSDTWSSEAIAIEPNGSNSQVGHVISWDTDGFTISWTKTGTPTGTARIFYIVNR